MKKIITFALVLFIILSVGCGSSKKGFKLTGNAIFKMELEDGTIANLFPGDIIQFVGGEGVQENKDSDPGTSNLYVLRHSVPAKIIMIDPNVRAGEKGRAKTGMQGVLTSEITFSWQAPELIQQREPHNSLLYFAFSEDIISTRAGQEQIAQWFNTLGTENNSLKNTLPPAGVVLVYDNPVTVLKDDKKHIFPNFPMVTTKQDSFKNQTPSTNVNSRQRYIKVKLGKGEYKRCRQNISTDLFVMQDSDRVYYMAKMGLIMKLIIPQSFTIPED
jgi:hypothetical protein